MRPLSRGLALTLVPALAVLVTGHNLVFLLTYGAEYGAALARTGHDARWTDAVWAVLTASTLFAVAAIVRIAYLHHLVRRLPAGSGRRPSGGTYFRRLLPAWARLFAIATALFVVQENYERWSVGIALPGLAVLGSFGVVGPVAVFLLVSLAVAAVVALFEWGAAALEALIAIARDRRFVDAPRAQGRTEPHLRPSSILGRNLAGRAPPASLTAQ
jgi:hypothetical protein